MNFLKVAALYIATLKAIILIHQQNHWVSQGENFYGSHLLFERIYNSALKDVDLAAEKFIGLFGTGALDWGLQTSLLNKVLLKYDLSSEDRQAKSLQVEQDFLKLSEQSYKIFKEAGKMTQGLDDALLSISSNREEAVYLLQQHLNKNIGTNE